MQKRKLVVTIASLLGIICAQALPAQRAVALPDCSAGTTLNIAAHPDDDLFFINPRVKQDIAAGKCVESIFLTAGEGTREADYWPSRENGIKAAYSDMIGEADIDASQDITINGHTARQYTFTAAEGVSVLFLRLPDGGDATINGGNSLQKLWQGAIASGELSPIVAWPSYTNQQLIDTLRVRMATLKPNVIRTLDFTQDFASVDHSDHVATALFAQAAHQDYTLPHQLIGYEGYELDNLTDNLAGDDYTHKLNAYYAYDPYDYLHDADNSGSKCPDISDTDTCYDEVERWIPRNYIGGAATKVAHSFEILDGDSGSLAGNTANTGQTPTAVQFGSDLWVFYYDASAGDLRYAKANASTPANWTFGTIDTANNVGRTPAAVVHNNTLHVFYYDATNTNLRHAWLPVGGSWQINNHDGDPGSIAVRSSHVDTGLMPAVTVFGGGLQLFYFEPTSQDLRHSWSNAAGTSWSFETFDGAPGAPGNHAGNVGYDPHAVVFNGMLHVFYYDASTGDLRLSKTNPGWQFSVLDGDSTVDGRRNATLGLNPSTAVYDNTLQVLYYDQTNGDLRHAWYNGTSNWQFENLDGDTGSIAKRSGAVGATPCIASDGTNLHAFALDAERGDLRHYWMSVAQPWQAETLDGRGDDGNTGRINGATGEDPVVISFANNWHVFYYESTNTNFRHSTL